MITRRVLLLPVAAKALGISIALSPGWAVTGSSSLLGELRYAARWSQEHGDPFSAKELVAMATSNPAAMAGIDEYVGSIAVGKYADLLVISPGGAADPYVALLEANSVSVELVMINGVPTYGSESLMRLYWPTADLSTIELPDGATKVLKMPGPGSFADLQAYLAAELKRVDSSLALVDDQQ